jgi:hypothetical protein
MKIKTLATVLVGLVLTLQPLGTQHNRDERGRNRDERGLSQSAETAILLAGAVVVAGIVVTVITAFVKSKLPK